MNRYKDLVSKHYEEINGVYEGATKKILEDLLSEDDTDLDTDEDVDKSDV